MFLKILSPCSGTYCCTQSPTSKCSNQTSNSINCSSSIFSSVFKYCSNSKFLNRFSNLSSIRWNIENQISSLNVSAGYNSFNSSNVGFANIQINNGWMLGIEIPSGSFASIGIDSSVTSNEDYEITSPSIASSTLSGTMVSINSSLKYKLMVRALIVKTSVISSFRAYPSSGTYAITATLSNTLIPGTPITVTKNVQIIQGITNLTITSPPMCERNVPCTLSSNVATGSSISYNWSFVDANETTSATSLSYIFTTFGVRLQYLVASLFLNCVPASVRIDSKNITISENITGLTFCQGKFCSILISASIIGKEANFNLMMQTGRDYTCLIDFGDSQKLMIDHTTVLNGSSVGHKYSNSEGVYTVVITCSNFLSSQTYQVQHHVQYEITNIQLIKKGAFLNTQYKVQFLLGTGTNAQVTFRFNNSLDYEMTYVESKKMGIGSERYADTIAFYPVNILAWNYVSSISFNDSFQISTGIGVPLLNIAPLLQSTTNAYPFETNLSFTIDITFGSNINYFLYTGEESSLKTQPINGSTKGIWTSPITISKNYKYPGNYNVTLILSNSLGEVSITKLVKVMTSVEGLCARVQTTPVLYLSSKGAARAYFQFFYNGSNNPASQGEVTINSGDQNLNPEVGPFWLGMDYIERVSKTPIFYDYQKQGEYNATINVKNERNNITFVLPIQVIATLDGLIVSFEPQNLAPGMTVKMATYITQGKNVTLEWIVDNQSLGVFSRTCKYLTLKSLN